MDRSIDQLGPRGNNGKRWRKNQIIHQLFYRLRSPSEWFFWSKFFDESTIAKEVGNLVMNSPLPDSQEIVFGRRAPFSSVSLLPSYEFCYWSQECGYGEQLVSLALFCKRTRKTALHERVSVPAIPETTQRNHLDIK